MGCRAKGTKVGKLAASRLARQLLAEQVVPHLCADKLGGTTGERDRPHNPRFQCREIKL